MTRKLGAAAFFFAALVADAVAQDGGEPTLESLQAQIDELRMQDQKQVMTGSSNVTVKFFGRTNFDAWVFPNTDDAINVFENGDPNDSPDTVLEVRRARIGVSGKVYDNMEYKTEIDFGKPNKLVFKDLYFGFNKIPGVQTLLIGNQKRPYGLDHLNSSRYNVFIERPYIIEGNNQDARRLGICAYGTDADQDWNWRYGVFEMTDFSGMGTIRAQELQPEVAARLASTAWWKDDGRSYAHWAVSGAVAFPDSNPAPGDTNQARFRTRPEARSSSRWLDTGAIANIDNYYLVGLEAVANLGPAQIVGELMNTWAIRSAGSQNLTFPGGYIYASYFLTGEHMPWSRKTGTLARPKPDSNLGPSGWGAWQVAARYSYANYSDADIFGGEGHSITFGLNWYWNPNASLQFNYIHGEVADRQITVGPTTYTEGAYDILGIRLRLDF